MSFDARTMPPAKLSGSPLPHEGTIDLPDQEHLEKLGYQVIDVRTVHGPELVELLLQGFALRTIPFEKSRMEALESMRIYWAKKSKQEAEDGLAKKSERPDVLSLLENIGNNQDVGVEPTKRRGRPKKDLP